MKLTLPILFLISTPLFATPSTSKIINKSNIINIDNEIQLLQRNTIANKRVFKVIEVKPNSTFKEIGYKKGDIVKKIDNETIINQNQLRAALDRQATEWENTSFDNDFSEGEIDIDKKSFDELEEEITQ